MGVIYLVKIKWGKRASEAKGRRITRLPGKLYNHIRFSNSVFSLRNNSNDDVNLFALRGIFWKKRLYVDEEMRLENLFWAGENPFSWKNIKIYAKRVFKSQINC